MTNKQRLIAAINSLHEVTCNDWSSVSDNPVLAVYALGDYLGCIEVKPDGTLQRGSGSAPASLRWYKRDEHYFAEINRRYKEGNW
jgi:hypothetical protein